MDFEEEFEQFDFDQEDSEEALGDLSDLLGCSRIPIPPIFRTFPDGEPFRQCIVCSRDLLDQDVAYHIEKGIRGSEVIFEYAMCRPCSIRMAQDLSRESMQRVAAHVHRNADLLSRSFELLRQSPDRVDPWLARCFLTGMPRQELLTCQIYGECCGKDLVLGLYPFMVGGPAMTELNGLLSKKTQERLSDFVGDYLGMPPEFRDLPEDFPVLMI